MHHTLSTVNIINKWITWFFNALSSKYRYRLTLHWTNGHISKGSFLIWTEAKQILTVPYTDTEVYYHLIANYYFVLDIMWEKEENLHNFDYAYFAYFGRAQEICNTFYDKYYSRQKWRKQGSDRSLSWFRNLKIAAWWVVCWNKLV